MRNFLLFGLSFLVAACGTPPVRTSDQTPPVAVFLAFPPYLQPTANRFAECATQQDSLSLFFTSIPDLETDLPGTILRLQLGGPIPATAEAYQVGEEEITIIVNSKNPTTDISIEDFLAIYSGKQIHWDFAEQPPIEVIAYPPDDALRSLLEDSLPGDPRLSSGAIIMPNPQAMLQAVANDQNAVGYLPSSWLDNPNDTMTGMVKVIPLEPSLTKSLTQPIIAIVSDPPSPELQAMLACMQLPDD